MSAVLKDANGNPVEGLQGNTTIPFSGSFTGENLKLAFTLNEWKAESRSFTLRAATTPSSVVVTTENHEFPSIFDSSPAVWSQSVYLLMLLSGLFLPLFVLVSTGLKSICRRLPVGKFLYSMFSLCEHPFVTDLMDTHTVIISCIFKLSIVYSQSEIKTISSRVKTASSAHSRWST